MINGFNIVVEQGEDGYLISEVVELPGCHTQAKTYDELIGRTKKAIALYLKVKKPIEEKRLVDIKNDPSIGKSETELNNYFKKRGIKVE